MNLQSVILLLIILLLVVIVLIALFRNHKKGKSAFGCGGACSNCPSAEFCRKKTKK